MRSAYRRRELVVAGVLATTGTVALAGCGDPEDDPGDDPGDGPGDDDGTGYREGDAIGERAAPRSET